MTSRELTSGSVFGHLGRNRFIETGFRFYPETGFGFMVQIKWTVCLPDVKRVPCSHIW